MIEDDDSFIQQEGLPPAQEDENRQTRSVHTLVTGLVVFVIWVIWTVACVLFFSGSVEKAVRDSGVLELLAQMSDEEEGKSTRTVQLAYPLADGSIHVMQVEAIRHGGDARHDTLEALIETYPQEALSHGGVNLIDRNTRLIGLTYADGRCYVDLSDDILDSPVLGSYTAFDQIADTLMLDDDIESVVFLIEGERLDALDGDGLAT